MDETWEQSLDIDDTDLPSLLRPCKRRHSTTENRRESPPPSSATPIPGPAGAVQAAMRRKDLDRRFNYSNGGVDSGSGGGVMSTQEYIRTAMSDASEFDDDFTRSPWLSALKFIGSEDCAAKRTPISYIKKCVGTGKIDLSVAVIKSSTPNGLGGLMVTLKDPSGTVGGSVHHRVLTESEFGRKLTVGAVIVLKKVAIFAPVRTAQYLNITLNNLVKVFSQDSGSTEKMDTASRLVQDADPDLAQDVMTDKTAREKQPCTNRGDNLQGPVSQVQEQSQVVVQGSERTNHKANVASGRGYKVHEEGMTRTEAFDQHFVDVSCEISAKENNNEGRDATRSIGKSGDEEIIRESDRVQIQKQPPILKSSLPRWTDEQLDELFAGQEDDDSLSLF